ncbi:hypothetical protein KS4_14770 [Poriferisphaera corsica]|uniref:Uncharacterized protein n=1 Tax=Poriferisphaera corsica TaxID=2528020 RepID=A0A517YT99_9BACT|nr:hypothetical protein [Poriferisphaera corsica]QDU33431.1 hypothetical protein KS4_14770 [Poriferisphaera corsica]
MTFAVRPLLVFANGDESGLLEDVEVAAGGWLGDIQCFGDKCHAYTKVNGVGGPLMFEVPAWFGEQFKDLHARFAGDGFDLY